MGNGAKDGAVYLPLCLAPPGTTSKANSAYFLCNQMDSGLNRSQTGTDAASLDTSLPVVQELD